MFEILLDSDNADSTLHIYYHLVLTLLGKARNMISRIGHYSINICMQTFSAKLLPIRNQNCLGPIILQKTQHYFCWQNCFKQFTFKFVLNFQPFRQQETLPANFPTNTIIGNFEGNPISKSYHP